MLISFYQWGRLPLFQITTRRFVGYEYVKIHLYPNLQGANFGDNAQIHDKTDCDAEMTTFQKNNQTKGRADLRRRVNVGR